VQFSVAIYGLTNRGGSEMATYRLGASGEQAKRIQLRLQALGRYRGPVDGLFGGGTESAVKAFQSEAGLVVDGVVGPVTWTKLFDDAFAPPSIVAAPVDTRCLALTGSFETGKGPPDCFAGISGDFDGQGISFGVCQWNFGQGSLVPLLEKMLSRHDAKTREIFQDHYEVFVAAVRSPREDLMAFARSIQDPARHFVYEPWRGMFRALGRTPEFQEVQVEASSSLLAAARALRSEYGLQSARALALTFDIKVQNGSISSVVRERIRKDFAALPPTLAGDMLEVEKMRIIAVRRAEASTPSWIDDVRARKLCIAEGHGRVHGVLYDLEEQYGLDLRPCA